MASAGYDLLTTFQSVLWAVGIRTGILYPSLYSIAGREMVGFRDVALGDRYKLLRSLSYHRRQEGGGPSATAYEVTTKAIAWGYVDDRPVPDGAKYDLWISKKNPPAWVAKGAARLLLGVEGYQPSDEGEVMAFALALVEAFPELDLDAIASMVPSRLLSVVTRECLSAAIDVRRVD